MAGRGSKDNCKQCQLFWPCQPSTIDKTCKQLHLFRQKQLHLFRLVAIQVVTNQFDEFALQFLDLSSALVNQATSGPVFKKLVELTSALVEFVIDLLNVLVLVVDWRRRAILGSPDFNNGSCKLSLPRVTIIQPGVNRIFAQVGFDWTSAKVVNGSGNCGRVTALSAATLSNPGAITPVLSNQLAVMVPCQSRYKSAVLSRSLMSILSSLLFILVGDVCRDPLVCFEI